MYGPLLVCVSKPKRTTPTHAPATDTVGAGSARPSTQDLRARALDALRVTPDGISGTEAKQWNPQERINAAFEAAKTHTQTRSEVNKEVTRIRNEIVAAGVEKKTAAQFASLHGANAIAMSTAYGIDPVALLQLRNFTSAEYVQGVNEEGLAKAARSDVNPDTLIDIVDLSDVVPFKINSENAKQFVALWNGAPLEIGTDASGKITARLSSKQENHPFWSSEESGRYKKERRAALKALDRILQGAIRIEDIQAKHKGVEQTISFYVPVQSSDGRVVALRIVAHEMAGQKAEIDGVEIYDIIQEKSPYSASRENTTHPSSGRRADTTSKVKIGDLLENVKDSDGKNYFEQLALYQTEKQGVTTFPDGKRLVTLFTGKWNASTIAHESMHVFLQDLLDIAADNGSGAIDTALRSIAGIVQGANNSEPYKAAKATIDAAIDRVANAGPESRMDRPQ